MYDIDCIQGCFSKYYVLAPDNVLGFLDVNQVVGHPQLHNHHLLQYQEGTSTLLLYDDSSLDISNSRVSLFGAHSPFQGQPSARLAKNEHPQWARNAG